MSKRLHFLRRIASIIGLSRATLLIGIVVLGVIWALVAGLGPGTGYFWHWTAESWEAVATGVTGLLLAFLAALGWEIQKRQVEVQANQQEMLYNPDLVISHHGTPSREAVNGVPKTGASFGWCLRAFNPGHVSINVGPILLLYKDKHGNFLLPAQRRASHDLVEGFSAFLQQREVSIYRVDNDSLEVVEEIKSFQQVEVKPHSHITLRVVILDDVDFSDLHQDSPVKLAVHIWYQVIGPSRSHKVAPYESGLFSVSNLRKLPSDK
jgi:hypothetical protein